MSQFLPTMRRAVLGGAAAAIVTNLTSENRIEAEEVQDMARIVFQPQSLNNNRPLISVSSDPHLNEQLIRIGSSLAANKAIQQLVQQEIEENWMLVDSVPGGAPIIINRETATTTTTATLSTSAPLLTFNETTTASSSSSYSSAATSTNQQPLPASPIDQLQEEEFSSPLQLEEVDESKEADVVADSITSSLLSDHQRSAADQNNNNNNNNNNNSRFTQIVNDVVNWIQTKLSGIFSLFSPPAAANSDCPSSSTSSSAASPPSSASVTSIAIGIAAVLIILITCRRFSPSIFHAAIRFLSH